MDLDSIEALLNSEDFDVLEERENWPSNMQEVLDSVDYKLSAKADLRCLSRPLLYLVSLIFGGCSLAMSRQIYANRFAIEKCIYDIYKTDPAKASTVMQKHRGALKDSTFQDVIKRQAIAHGDMKSQDKIKAFKWWGTLIELLNAMDAYLCEYGVERERRDVLKLAIIDGMSMIRLRPGAIYLPECKKITALLRQRAVGRHMKKVDANATARHFNISKVHVYRLLREERQRQKEARDRKMTPI